MTFVHLDSAHLNEGVHPEYDESIKCLEYPDSEVDSGYGLAGGGFGPYTVCCVCCKILSKSVEPLDDDEASALNEEGRLKYD